MLDREKKIAGGLEAAERSKRDLEIAEHKALNIIREAKQEATHIVDLAHKHGQSLIEEAKQDARNEAQRIAQHAQDEIAREVTLAKEGLRKQLATLAVAGATKIIKRNLDVASQTALLDEFVAEI